MSLTEACTVCNEHPVYASGLCGPCLENRVSECNECGLISPLNKHRICLQCWKKKERARKLWQQYKLTSDEADLIQGSPCGLCDRPPPSVIDHDHATGRVRGPLCRRCNTNVGMLEGRTKEWLEAAQRWITE